jgi:thiamine transporter ThiT
MVLGTLVIIGALLISTDRIQNIRIGGLIVLTTAMVSLFTISDRYYGYEYGYFLGFLGGVLLSIIGSILAVAWKPKLTVAQRNP